MVNVFQGNDFSEAQEGDPKYLAPELMDGKYSKAADIFRYVLYVLCCIDSEILEKYKFLSSLPKNYNL
jgi:hypothetical protein